MRGLIFGVSTTPSEPLPDDALARTESARNGADGSARHPGPDAARGRLGHHQDALCGICGSDSKQVFIDGDGDSSMTAMISFPQVLGHEVVGEIVEAGSTSGRRVGERVVLNPWLSCGPRGISPMCPSVPGR